MMNGCTGAQQEFTITVNPLPIVDDPLDQIKCQGDMTDEVAFTGTGGAT
jgi:hypothetical protein